MPAPKVQKTASTAPTGKVGYLQPHPSQFAGAYKTSSVEYKISRTYARMPPSYRRVVLLFHGTFETIPRVVFNAGQLITVGVDKPGCHDGHSVFGFVYEVRTSLARGQQLGYYWQMEVEVHSIPGYQIDWQHARPFVVPPIGSVFIQPHGFKEAIFELLSQLSPERWEMIKVDLGSNLALFNPISRSYRLCRPEDRLPPREVYPQTESHGLLASARILLREAANAPAAPLQPRQTALPPSLIHRFDNDMRYLRDRSMEENGGRKRKFAEIEDGGGLQPKR